MVCSCEDRYGLDWVRTTFSIEPRWTVDVNLESIKHEVELALDVKCHQIRFYAQGGFNKIYEALTNRGPYIMRVSLPVDPQRKTNSEVATIEWIRQNTALPVPVVIAYDNHRENPVRFEWILMTKMSGRTLASAWRLISLEAKLVIIQQLANYSSTLFENQKCGIGSLYTAHNDQNLGSEQSNGLGKVVSMDFLWGNRLKYSVPRGPFGSSREWISVRLSMSEKDCRSILVDPQSDEDDLDDSKRTLRIIQKLLDCLNAVLPEKPLPEPSILHHDDLSQHNVMVDNNGTITGVVDWECVTWVPPWKACYYPSFLQGRTRKLRPDRDKYQCKVNGEPDELYWDHLKEYELTLLRNHFLDEMRHLQPRWVEIFDECRLQRDLDYAVKNCDNEFLARDIEEWIETIDSGEKPFDLRNRVLAEQVNSET